MTPEFAIEHGAQFPYDAPEAWWNDPTAGSAHGTPPPPATDWAHAAARGILADLTNRRGIKRGFEEIDYDTKAQIVTSFAAIIRVAHGQAP